jgi:hypothetical protein
MSNSSRFAGLKQSTAPVETMPAPSAQAPAGDRRGRNPREGKKAVVGYFTPAVSKGLHLLAIDQDSSIQALLGEAIDDLMRKHGKHPFGEK